MAVSGKKATFLCDIQKVWDTVTSLDHYSWRNDLDRIEILNEKQFVEYSREGYATTFTITATEPCGRWEFDMENDNMKGHWIGVFSQDGTTTTVDFTEIVQAKKWFMKPFVGMYLKKQQAAYLEDLEKALK